MLTWRRRLLIGLLLAIGAGVWTWHSYERAVTRIQNEWSRRFRGITRELGRLRLALGSEGAVDLDHLWSTGQVARKLAALHAVELASMRLLRVIEQPRELVASEHWFDFVVDAGVERAMPPEHTATYIRYLRAEAEFCWHAQRAIELVRDHWGKLWWERGGFHFADGADDNVRRVASKAEARLLVAIEDYIATHGEVQRVRVARAVGK